MKKLLLLLATAALAAGSATAQTAPAPAASAQQPTPGGRPRPMQRGAAQTPEQMADRLTKQLALSAAQRAQLVALEQTRRAETQAQRDQLATGTDRATMRRNAQGQREQYDGKLQEILTPEQYSRYRQLREERQSGREGRKAAN